MTYGTPSLFSNETDALAVAALDHIRRGRAAAEGRISVLKRARHAALKANAEDIVLDNLERDIDTELMRLEKIEAAEAALKRAIDFGCDAIAADGGLMLIVRLPAPVPERAAAAVGAD